MSNEPYIYKNPRVGLAALIMMIGGMIAAPGLGVLSASSDDENTIRMQFEKACMRHAAANGDITEDGSTLTSVFTLSDVRACLDAQVRRTEDLNNNAVDMMKIGGLVMLLGGTLLIPARKNNEDGPKPPRR